MRKKQEIISGTKYHKLTIQKEVEPIVSSKGVIKRMVSCTCECGNAKVVNFYSLRSGNTTSCGCEQKIKSKLCSTKHGMWMTTEYRTWYSMKRRCYNPNYRNYQYWGGRGIRVCDRWLNSFENFYKDMGTKPSELHTLDRIDNDGMYEPSNCRWSTKKEQANNRINKNYATTRISEGVRQ